jgi:Periplasmic protease
VIHFDDITKYPTEVTDAVVEALKAFKTAGVTSLVLDLRGNRGGSDQVAADISGFFAGEEAFYERTAWYNASSGRFDLAYSDLFAQTFELSDRALWVVPRGPHFEGEIAVLVNPATISSGEGLAMAIGRLPDAKVLGFYGTHGSFGLIPWPLAMPEGFAFEYPIGRSLDASGRIQIDADASGSGGIQPSIRVPRTAETMAAFASGTDVELEYARRWLISH